MIAFQGLYRKQNAPLDLSALGHLNTRRIFFLNQTRGPVNGSTGSQDKSRPGNLDPSPPTNEANKSVVQTGARPKFGLQMLLNGAQWQIRTANTSAV